MKFFCVFIAVVALMSTSDGKKPKLQKYNIDSKSVTVSGFSAGAGMASQMHVAYSSLIRGAAMFAGFPYVCALMFTATVCQQTPTKVNVTTLVSITKKGFKDGRIDNPANLKNQKAWIFHGTKDSTVLEESGRQIEEFYKAFGTKVTTVFDTPVGHVVPIEKCGGVKQTCSYNGPFESLKAMYGSSLVKPTSKSGIIANIVDFDQTEFDSTPLSLADDGFLYVPNACKKGKVKCKLHVVFHGCSRKSIYGYVTETGYMDVAEANNIVILAPLVDTRLNKYYCFDWTRYTGLNYATRNGTQMTATYNMINRLMGDKSSSKKGKSGKSGKSKSKGKN